MLQISNSWSNGNMRHLTLLDPACRVYRAWPDILRFQDLDQMAQLPIRGVAGIWELDLARECDRLLGGHVLGSSTPFRGISQGLEHPLQPCGIGLVFVTAGRYGDAYRAISSHRAVEELGHRLLDLLRQVLAFSYAGPVS